MSWYKTGFESMKDEAVRQESRYAVPRFFMKPKETANLVFVDDEAFTFYEHGLRKDGDWDNFTCIAANSPENPVCCARLGEESRYFVGMFTVVDGTKFISRTDPNKVYQYGVKLFAAKFTVMSILQRKREAHTSLIGIKCTVARDTDKSPNTGNDFTFTEPVKDLRALFEAANYKGKKLSELWDKAESDPEEMRKLQRIFQLRRDPNDNSKLVRAVVPFNYAQILEPKSVAEATRYLSGNVQGNTKSGAAGGGRGGTGGATGGGSQSEDAPF